MSYKYDVDVRNIRRDILDMILERERDCNRCTSDNKPNTRDIDILDRITF